METSSEKTQDLEWRSSLKAGDKFAVEKRRYGTFAGYEILLVERVTKTQVVVDCRSYQRRFALSDGYERATDSDNLMMPITQKIRDHFEHRRLLTWLTGQLQNTPSPTLEQLRAMKAAFDANKPIEGSVHE